MVSGNRVFPMPNVVFFAVPIRVSFKFLNVITRTTKDLFHFLYRYSRPPQTKVYEHDSKIAKCPKRTLFTLKIKLA